MTTFEVMQQVSGKLAELPESSKVASEAVANIFGGPGQDAGYKYLTTLKDMSVSMDEVKEKSGNSAACKKKNSCRARSSSRQCHSRFI